MQMTPCIPRNQAVSVSSLRAPGFCRFCCHNHACRSIPFLTSGLGTPRSPWVHQPQHDNRGLAELHKGAIKDLEKARSSSMFWTFVLTPSMSLTPVMRANLSSAGTQKQATFRAILAVRTSACTLPTRCVPVPSFFTDKLPPCFSKHLLSLSWGIVFLRHLLFSSAKLLCFFLRVSGTAGAFFFSSAFSMVPARKEL